MSPAPVQCKLLSRHRTSICTALCRKTRVLRVIRLFTDFPLWYLLGIMDEHLNQVLNGTDAAAAAATAALLGELRSGRLNVLELVALLKRPLTDEADHEGRAKAVQLLAKVSSETPEALLRGEVGVLAEFLAAKLKDWRCVVAAAPGCLALLQRHRQPALPQLPEAAAVALVHTFTGVHVQALDYKGRIACYQLLLEILQGPYGAAAVLSGIDLVSCTVVAMENEADPRCLMFCLRCVQAVGKMYNQPGLLALNHLHQGLEDLFDVGVVPYFPVMFKPQKNDPKAVTREQLLHEVIAAMGCCPQFAALGIPLLSEKLGSSLSQAKADALQALPTCCKAWGSESVTPHLQAVWLMLKAELLAPAAAEGLLPDQLATKYATAAAAAAALRDTLAALTPGLLDMHVLNDVCMEDLQQYLGLLNPPWAASSGNDSQAPAAAAAAWDLPEKAQRRLACIARVVAAVAAAGDASCAAVCKHMLQPAVTAVLDDTVVKADTFIAAAACDNSSSSSTSVACMRPLQANCGVLCVLHNVLNSVADCIAKAEAAAAADTSNAAAAAAATAEYGTASKAYAALADLVPGLATALTRLQSMVHSTQQQQQQDTAAAAEILQAHQLQLWLLLVWQDLMTLPSSIACLQQQVVDAAANEFVQLALHGSTVELELQLAPGSTSCSTAAAAAAALTRMADWPSEAATAAAAAATEGTLSGMQALQKHAAPLLLQLLQQQHGSSSSSSADVDEYSRALELLQSVSVSSAASAWQVLLWLQPLVLSQVQRHDMVSLCTFIPILYCHCVPVLPDSLAPAESATAAEFCTAFLQAWQQQQQHDPSQCSSSSSDDVLHKVLLHSCLLLGTLAAKCSKQDQQSLMLTGCEWVATAAAAAAAAATEDAAPVTGPACLAAAVLAAARPGLLTANSVVDLAAALATLAATAAAGNSSSSDPRSLDRFTAGIALASVINKCCGDNAKKRQNEISSTGDINGTAVSVDVLLAATVPQLLSCIEQWPVQRTAQQQQHYNESSTSCTGSTSAVGSVLGAAHATAWVARGLAMQRHDGWQQCMQALLQLLPAAAAASESDSGVPDPVQQQQQQVMWAAADFFSILVASPEQLSTPGASTEHGQDVQVSSSSSSDTITLGLQLNLHTIPRPLWQQKAFTLASQALSAAISSQQQALLDTGDAAGHQQQQQQQGASCGVGEGLWLAVAGLLTAAPSAVILAAREQAVPLLLQTLVVLTDMWPEGGQQSPAAAAAAAAAAHLYRLLQLLHSCLLMVADLLLDADTATPLLDPHVSRLLDVLCKLARLTVNSAAAAAVGSGTSSSRTMVDSVATVARNIGAVAAGRSSSSSSSSSISAAVREVALTCMTRVLVLPYHMLHPSRPQVAAVLNAALDDDRRAVRKAAVLAKGSWTGAVPI